MAITVEIYDLDLDPEHCGYENDELLCSFKLTIYEIKPN